MTGLFGGQISKKGNSIYKNRIAQTVGVTPVALHRSESCVFRQLCEGTIYAFIIKQKLRFVKEFSSFIPGIFMLY
jgi:hypothetical protein